MALLRAILDLIEKVRVAINIKMGNVEPAANGGSGLPEQTTDHNNKLILVVKLFENLKTQKRHMEQALARATDTNDDPMSLNLTTELILKKVENQHL